MIWDGQMDKVQKVDITQMTGNQLDNEIRGFNWFYRVLYKLNMVQKLIETSNIMSRTLTLKYIKCLTKYELPNMSFLPLKQ